MPAYIVTGLGFGDEGKGAVTDHLVRSTGARKVVLHNGGAQRAHNVVLPDGTHHTFSQFCSGTFAGADTILGPDFLVNPHALFDEMELLRQKGYWMRGKLSVFEDALITTPIHVAANRLRERLRGNSKHGSCGMGIGETVSCPVKLYAKDLHDEKLTRKKLGDMQHFYSKEFMVQIIENCLNTHHSTQTITSHFWIDDAMAVYRIFAKVFPQLDEFEVSADESIIFEGGQGVLLDQFYGFHPHTTWSDTTTGNADKMLIDYQGEIRKVGVMRSYMTRHGAGPFVTEDPALSERFPEAHNGHGEWQGSWRVGWTDLAAIKYALEACPVDELAVTHLDRVEKDWKICLGYLGSDAWPVSIPSRHADRKAWEHERRLTLIRLQGAEPEYAEFDNMDSTTFIDVVESALKIPVTRTTHGPTYFNVRELIHA